MFVLRRVPYPERLQETSPLPSVYPTFLRYGINRSQRRAPNVAGFGDDIDRIDKDDERRRRRQSDDDGISSSRESPRPVREMPTISSQSISIAEKPFEGHSKSARLLASSRIAFIEDDADQLP